MTAKEQRKRDVALAKQAERFHARLSKPADRAPGFAELAVFRMGRASIGLELDETSRDYRYYSEKGGFDSDYYYATQLGPIKKAVGRVFDAVGARMARARAS